MGQYYLVVNVCKRQFLHPHKFGDGLKLLEFGCSGGGTMTGLAVLLSSGNGRGGGDLRSKNPVVGSWAGDRIVVAGDYGDPGLFVLPVEAELVEAANELKPSPTLFDYASNNFEDISYKVIEALADDDGLKEDLAKSLGHFSKGDVPDSLKEKLGID